MTMSEPFISKPLMDQLLAHFHSIFQPGFNVIAARAPARLDVMGGIADSSGSLVLEGTLDRETLVAVQSRSDQDIVIHSVDLEPSQGKSTTVIPLDILFEAGYPIQPVALHSYFNDKVDIRWAAYVIGVFSMLLDAGLISDFTHGLNIGITSNIPLGGGVSSSAALEVAAMIAISKIYDVSVPPNSLPALCQRVENEVVGAPCGIMDQMTSALGQKDRLLALKCQPHEILGYPAVPEGIRFLGMNSDVKHTVSGSAYTDTRVGTFMGRKILFDRLMRQGKSVPLNGYLSNVPANDWRSTFREWIPEQMTGAEFIQRYQTHDDPVTQIDPEEMYFPQKRAEHPILENDRVTRFMNILSELENGLSESLLIEAGELMIGSHRSYSDNCDMGSEETDLIVDLVMRRGPSKGLYGAKITGGGSGGTVALLAREGAESVLDDVAAEYEKETGRHPDLFWKTTPGGVETQTIELRHPK